MGIVVGLFLMFGTVCDAIVVRVIVCVEGGKRGWANGGENGGGGGRAGGGGGGGQECPA